MTDAQTTNLLGALSVAIADAQLAAMTEASGLSPSDVASILTLGPNPDSSVSDMARILNLTHSAAVRLADRLEDRDLVARMTRSDRREVALRLTAKGRRLRRKIANARAAVLNDAVETLPDSERAAFDRCVRALLVRLTSSRTRADRLCRLCDEDLCPKERCPVECRAAEIERVS
jgi:DNA-binding MarR family transcriptional regulator